MSASLFLPQANFLIQVVSFVFIMEKKSLSFLVLKVRKTLISSTWVCHLLTKEFGMRKMHEYG